MKGREDWGKLRRWWAFQWFKFMRIVKKIIRSECTSHSIAMGNSIGFFIGLQPCVGSQTVAGLLLAALFRANKLATLLPCWITNPATIVPIYAFNYWIGYLITGWGPNQEEFKKALIKAEEVMADNGFWGFFSGVAEALRELLSYGWGAFFSLLLGSVIVGLVLAVVVYPPTVYLVKHIRALRDARRSKRHERVSSHLSQRTHAHGSHEHQTPPHEQ